MTCHIFNPTILREYDIRGRVDETLNADDAYALGLAFGTHLLRAYDKNHVAIGYDGRLTSPTLAEALIKGLNNTGVDTILIGLGPSPMLYYAVQALDVDAGIMVTGSHNPPAYNGFKMSLKNASIYGSEIQDIGKIAAKGHFETGSGSAKTVQIQSDYATRLLKDLNVQKPLKIVWDNGNGAAGNVLKSLVADMPGEHYLLYDDIDGTFPNHHPDPTVDDNLSDLIQAVHDQKCDFGVAFDGDGDRIGVVDEHGTILRCDDLMAIYAADVLANQAGASIIGDVKCSNTLFEEIERLGGNPVMAKTGHSLVKAKMKETKAPLAGELSGHIFFADRYYGYDDALYCAVRLMNIVSRADNLSSLTAHLPPRFSTPEIRIDVPEEDKFTLVERIKKVVMKKNEGAISDLDGVRVRTSYGWWIVRASNTQNALSVRAESESAEGLAALKAEIKTLLEAVIPTFNNEAF